MDVLVVDEHPLTRYALCTLLAPVARVVHEADEPVAALECARRQRPDVVVLDLRLRREMAGIGLCRSVKRLAGAPRVMVYSAHNAAQHIVSALAAGADSYVDRATSCAGVVDAVARTAGGDRVWALEHQQLPVAPTPLASPAAHLQLTRREQEVLALVLRRRTNEEIAEELVLARQTVKNHVCSALRKLGVTSRRELFATTRGRGPAGVTIAA
jgi:DNA-binding NarL/FixJ family response regulator